MLLAGQGRPCQRCVPTPVRTDPGARGLEMSVPSGENKIAGSAQPPREATLTKWGEFQGRVEDSRLVTGQGSYVGDIRCEGMAHAVLVRAQVASANLVSIDTAAALASPGVLAVYTASDLAEDGLADFPCGVELPRPDGRTAHQARRPVLARNRIRCVGEAIAFV